jgi:TRAP-type C4-dicarboxylate transport system substrate-binding protein
MGMTSVRRLAGAALVAAGLAAAAPASAQTEIIGSIWFPDSHPLTKFGYLDLVEPLARASNNQLRMRVFTGTALLPPGAHLSGLRDGVAQMTYHAGTYTPSDLPEDNVIAILGIALQDNVAVAAAVSDFYLNDPAMREMFKRNRIVFLGGYATPPYILMCRTKIETLADIRGKRIRMPGAIHADWARSVGAVPVNVPSTEMFTGLEKGQLDCAANAANDLRSRSLWDVAKHVTTIDLGSYSAGWQYAMNAQTWGRLSPANRRALLDTVSDAIVDTAIGYQADADAALAEAPSRGVNVIRPGADLQQQLTQFNATTARETALREGAERFRLRDAPGMVQRFEATVAKWQGLLQGVDRKDAAALKRILRENLYGRIDAASHGS